MKRMLPLAVGGAVGYVMGTKAGHERYEFITGTVQSAAKRWPRNELGRPLIRPSRILGRVSSAKASTKGDEAGVREELATEGSAIQTALTNEGIALREAGMSLLDPKM